MPFSSLSWTKVQQNKLLAIDCRDLNPPPINQSATRTLDRLLEHTQVTKTPFVLSLFQLKSKPWNCKEDIVNDLIPSTQINTVVFHGLIQVGTPLKPKTVAKIVDYTTEQITQIARAKHPNTEISRLLKEVPKDQLKDGVHTLQLLVPDYQIPDNILTIIL